MINSIHKISKFIPQDFLSDIRKCSLTRSNSQSQSGEKSVTDPMAFRVCVLHCIVLTMSVILPFRTFQKIEFRFISSHKYDQFGQSSKNTCLFLFRLFGNRLFLV